MPRKILDANEPRLYRLEADQDVVKPTSYAQVALLKGAVSSILHKYLEKYYRVHQERWDSAHMKYMTLDAADSNFKDYTVKMPRTDTELIAAVVKLIRDGDRIYREETKELPNIHFSRHLYQPLIVECGDRIKTDPKGLTESEQQFVRDLKEFVQREAGKSLAHHEVYLLRNLSRGRGIGFFENEGFYPDFILWIREEKKQRVTFVEPHGMRQEKAYWTSDKVRLHERLRELSIQWGNKSPIKGIVLDCFIISRTPYDELREIYGEQGWSKADFAERHILFFERTAAYDYIPRLFATD
jgi:hypothetical protein